MPDALPPNAFRAASDGHCPHPGCLHRRDGRHDRTDARRGARRVRLDRHLDQPARGSFLRHHRRWPSGLTGRSVAPAAATSTRRHTKRRGHDRHRRYQLDPDALRGRRGHPGRRFLAALRRGDDGELGGDGDALHLDGAGEDHRRPGDPGSDAGGVPCGISRGSRRCMGSRRVGSHRRSRPPSADDRVQRGWRRIRIRGMQHVRRPLRDRWRHDLVRADGDDEDGLPATRQRG